MHVPVRPNDCVRAREDVSARLDGELSEFEVAHLEAHLDACADCGAYAHRVGLLTARLRAEPLVAPPPHVTTVYRRRRPLSRLTVAAAAATLAVAAGSSFIAGHVVAHQGGGGGVRSVAGAGVDTSTGATFVGRPPGIGLAAVIDGGGLPVYDFDRPAPGRAVAI